jgi:hypothetical protein
MGPVEHLSLAEQANTDTRTLAFTQLCAKLDEQRFDYTPPPFSAPCTSAGNPPPTD